MNIGNEFDEKGRIALLKTEELDVEIRNLYSQISNLNSTIEQLANREVKSPIPLGTVFCFAVEPNDSKFAKLNGKLLSKQDYPEFYEFMRVKRYESGVKPFCEIGEYASDMLNYGQCGKFVFNDTIDAESSNGYVVGPEMIKLPTITEFIASNNGGENIGACENDDIKAHTHNMIYGVMCDKGTRGGFGLKFESIGSDHYCATTHGFDSGSGTETKPKNVRYPFYIVVK